MSQPSHPQRRSRPSFTLVELLVVIAIIGILASLAMVGVMSAMTRARTVRIKLEIDNMAGAFHEYKTEHGAFPPNLVTTQSFKYTPARYQARIKADLVQHFKRAFPRSQEPDQLFNALVGISGGLDGGMSPGEAIVFWLGGFSDDVRYPISGAGGPAYNPDVGEVLEDRNRIYDFDITRLGPRNQQGFFDENRGRFIQYQVPGLGTRRINFWTYSPKGLTKPFVYFDTSRHKPYRAESGKPFRDYDPLWQGVSPIKRLSQSTSSSASPKLFLQFANPDSFQILHPGLDDDWGDGEQASRLSLSDEDSLIVYPDGPFTEEIADTLTNFSEGTLEDSEP